MRENSLFLDSLAEEAWNHMASDFKSIKGAKTYWGDINLFLDFIEKPFHNVDQNDALKYYNHCRSMINSGDMKVSTARKKFRVLSRFADAYANYHQQHAKKVFVNHFSVYATELNRTTPDKLTNYPSLGQIDRLLDVCKTNLGMYTMITLVYRIGLAPIELCAIKLSSFFIVDDTVFLRTKRQKNHFVRPLPDDVKDIVDHYIKKVNPDQNEPLFRRSKGIPYTERTLEYMMNEIVAEAGLSGITLYDIRNTAAITMLECGCSEEVVSEALGIGIMAVQRYKGLNYRSYLEELSLVNIRIINPADRS